MDLLLYFDLFPIITYLYSHLYYRILSVLDIFHVYLLDGKCFTILITHRIELLPVASPA